MRRRKNKIFALATIAMILILWLTSCTSTDKNRPSYTPPDPYDADGNLIWQYDAETDSVTVPYWYWELIVDYFIDTQEQIKAQGEK